MKIVYRVSEEDFMEAYRLFIENEKPRRKGARRRMPWAGAMFLAFAGAIIVIGLHDKNPLHDLPYAIFFALLGAYLLYCGFALRGIFRKMYQNNPRSQHEITADISEDGVHVVTPTADTHLKWNAIIRFAESEKIFMLFYAEWSFSVVPKNAFAPGETELFRDILKRKVSPPTMS